MSNRLTNHRQSREHQKAATRSLFLRVGRRIFAKHGFDATSVAMLCRSARTTHGALYHHFQSKQDLFIAVLKELTEEIASKVLQATVCVTGWQQVEAACHAYLEVCTDSTVQQIVFRDGPRVLATDTFDAIDHGVNQPLVTALLLRWVEEGLLCESPITLIARMLGGAFAEAGAVIAESKEPLAVRQHAETVLLAWLGSLRATV